MIFDKLIAYSLTMKIKMPFITSLDNINTDIFILH